MQVKNGNKISGRFRINTWEAGTKNLVSKGEWQKNLISTATNKGLNRIIKLLNGESLPLKIVKARIGTGSTTPTVNDTDLETPLDYDILIADQEEVDNTTLRFEFFIPNAFLPDDDYTEFGTYCGEDTDLVNVDLFSRALITPTFEKAGSVDVTIDYEYTINNITS